MTNRKRYFQITVLHTIIIFVICVVAFSCVQICLAMEKSHLADGIMLYEKGNYDEDKLTTRTPMGRLGKCEEVADTAIFLSSEESRYITGQTIVVDGGWTSYMYLESWLQEQK